MLRWALIFFVISIIAGVFGFTGIAAGSAAIAKILFFFSIVLFSLVSNCCLDRGASHFQVLNQTRRTPCLINHNRGHESKLDKSTARSHAAEDKLPI